MDISKVVTQLKTYCPELQMRVAGAAEFEAAAEQGYLDVPAAYVIPLSDDAGDNDDSNGLTQKVTESVNIILVLDNKADRRGQAASISVEQWKYKIHKALLNWHVDPVRAAKGLAYEGSSLGDINGARLFWTMTYSHTVWLTDEDGFQPPSEDLLHVSGNNPALGDNSWQFDQPIDQTPAT